MFLFFIFVVFFFQNILEENNTFLKCTTQLLKNEIAHRKILVLNNKSLLRVVYNKILSVDVMVSFSPSNIPYIFLNEYNTGMLKFTVEIKEATNIVPNHKSSNEKTKINQIKDSSIPNTCRSEYYDLKYVSEI